MYQALIQIDSSPKHCTCEGTPSDRVYQTPQQHSTYQEIGCCHNSRHRTLQEERWHVHAVTLTDLMIQHLFLCEHFSFPK